MTDSNPFVLPGMGQDTDLSGNPLLASMEMMRQAWASLAGPGGLGQSLPLTPPMNLEDLERRIAELRTVEGWLRLNLQMLSSSIQGMEVQRATIATLRSFVGSASGSAAGSEGDPSPLEVALGLRPAKADKPAKPEASAAADGAEAAGSERVNAAAQSASQAWWELLNQQFSQIAAATAASLPAMMPGMDAMAQAAAGGAESAPAAKPASAAPKKAAPRKAAKPAKTDPAKPAAAAGRARAASKVARKSTRAS
ncbi:PhaM family polyhydroxyalkanoate granule multifunctional regulatory protein [Bordetella genomosp. 12]|uniref:Transcriptional regulator n=1 Tax=Bordetella genomosp. 12 TaxID=463035 RepID=A0A261VTU1_9BORD|nr:PhaM family polyhydroxyalkanoate granule multifunctional regulatory protein [Bordetella genomosp. 12]OZI77181.1 transcriptional regulator [Bordetella genomosp. 12]